MAEDCSSSHCMLMSKARRRAIEWSRCDVRPGVKLTFSFPVVDVVVVVAEGAEGMLKMLLFPSLGSRSTFHTYPSRGVNSGSGRYFLRVSKEFRRCCSVLRRFPESSV